MAPILLPATLAYADKPLYTSVFRLPPIAIGVDLPTSDFGLPSSIGRQRLADGAANIFTMSTTPPLPLNNDPIVQSRPVRGKENSHFRPHNH